jgi:hypothetical protein
MVLAPKLEVPAPMNKFFRASLPAFLVAVYIFVPATAIAMSVHSSSFPKASVQMRPLKPGFPPRPLVPGQSSPTTPTTIRYSQSARAGNMVLPAIWLGLPTIVIIALIIRSMKGD